MIAVHTHTQRAQPTTVAHYLLAVIEQLERDTARLKAAYERTNRNPLGACAITGTGFPIDRAADLAICSASAVRPATPTAASRRWTTCSRARRRRRCCSPDWAASCRTCCSGARRVRLRAPRRWLRAVQQHHAAEAQPGRARARARDRQQGARPGAGDRHSPSTTRRSATSSTPKTICSRSCSSMFRDATRIVRLVAAAMSTAEFDASGWRRAPATAGRR